jgi:hypothetical protein
MSISVIQSGKKKRYLVRVTRRGKQHAKMFARKRDAVQFENELLKNLGPPKSQKGVPKNTPAPKSTGIKRIVKRKFKRHGRKPVNVYTVYWRTPQGEPRYTNISIDVWGAKKALALAKKKKREMDRAQIQGS